MAKGLFIGNELNTSNKVKKIYVGVDGTARKVKKIYIGSSDNIAKTAYNENKKVSIYGALSSLIRQRSGLSGSSFTGNSKYAIFGGGTNYNSSTSTWTKYSILDIYNESLVKISYSNTLSDKSAYLSSEPVGDYILFAGGDNAAYGGPVDAINSSLSISSAEALQNEIYTTSDGWSSWGAPSVYMAHTTIGTSYACFGYGYRCNQSNVGGNGINVYNAQLSRSFLYYVLTANNVMYANAAPAGDSIAIFTRGRDVDKGNITTSTSVNTSLTKTPLVDATHADNVFTYPISVGEFAIFPYRTIHESDGTFASDVYNSKGTKTFITTNFKSNSFCAGSHTNFGIFAYTNNQYSIDENLTISPISPYNSSSEASATLGDYVLFTGTSNTYAYKIE